MPVVDNEVTSPGQRGLTPGALNVLAHWRGFPNSSGTANVFSLTVAQLSSASSTASSTQAGTGSTQTTRSSYTTWSTAQTTSTTVMTQLDYCRNLAYSFSASAGSTSFSAGAVKVKGNDLFNNTVSESKPITSLISSGTFYSGTQNFAKVTGATIQATFRGSTMSSVRTSDSNGGTTGATAGSAAASATFCIGAGAKLGVLPIYFNKLDAVVWASINSIARTTTTGTASTDNAFSVFTGPYGSGGFSFTSAITSTEGIEVSYKLNGRNLF